MPPGSLQLSLVIPVYNYGDKLKTNITEVLTRLRAEKIPFELVLVNDGSADRTPQAMRELSLLNPEIKTVSYEKNHGKGYAVKRGMEKATGACVFFTDVDLPYGLEPVLAGCRVIARNEADIVLGSRDLPESRDILSYNWSRKLAKRVFSSVVNLVFRFNITDTQCGLKGFSRQSARKIFSLLTIDGFGFDVEILCLAARMGYKTRLIPVRLKHSSISTVSLFGDSIKMLGSLVKIKINTMAGRYDSENKKPVPSGKAL